MSSLNITDSTDSTDSFSLHPSLLSFPEHVSLKMNVIERLEFELAY